MNTLLRRYAAAIAALMIAGLASKGSAQSSSVGLSPVRSRLFGQDSEVASAVRIGDRFASALAAADFDNDGADDLALGVPYADGPFGSEVQNEGLVVVRYGLVGRGLAGGDGEALSRSLFPAYEPGDQLGAALAACDFDGDGFADLAMGAPGETLSPTLIGAGAVIVAFGSAGGLDGQRFQVFDEETPGIPLSPLGADAFGASLACGDFDGDGKDDLVVGAPGEWIGGAPSAGAVFVLPGSSGGLVAAASVELDQDHGAITGVAEEGDLFGWALAAGDFDGDGRADLAVGVPGEDDARGAFHVFLGTPTGLSPADGVYRDESGVGGLSGEADDLFAAAFGVGDFDGDGRDDLVVGIPWKNLETAGGTVTDCGQVAVLYGAAVGFDFGRTQLWSQDSIFGSGTSETDDWFGWAMAAADFDGDGRDDLAVGSPSEFVTGPGDGAASVFMGSASGLVAVRRRGIASGLEGWPGNASQHGRELSTSLAAGDFDGDGHGDLVLGAPFEDRGPPLISDTGTSTVVYGSLFSDGFETGDRRFWSAGSP